MSPLVVHGVGRNEQDAGARVLRQFPGQDLTMADAVGLHLMQTMKIRHCWSTDYHLALTGVPLVIHLH